MVLAAAPFAASRNTMKNAIDDAGTIINGIHLTQ
jgi:hypothetical protein